MIGLGLQITTEIPQLSKTILCPLLVFIIRSQHHFKSHHQHITNYNFQPHLFATWPPQKLVFGLKKKYLTMLRIRRFGRTARKTIEKFKLETKAILIPRAVTARGRLQAVHLIHAPVYQPDPRRSSSRNTHEASSMSCRESQSHHPLVAPSLFLCDRC